MIEDMGSKVGSTTPRKDGQIPVEIAAIERTIDSIHNAITSLEEKIHTVVNPKEELSKVKESIPYPTPLAERLRIVKETANVAYNRIVSLIDSIEL